MTDYCADAVHLPNAAEFCIRRKARKSLHALKTLNLTDHDFTRPC